MTALQVCGMVNDPSAQIRQKQYEMPDNLPDDLATIDIDAFAKLSNDNAAPLVSPTPTALTPAAPLAASVTPATPLAASATPATPLAASARPATPLAASARPATPLAASARPATPLAASVTPATPCVTDCSEVSVGEEIIRTCVTPSKVKEVEAMLKVERQRHLCALKLLHFFFSKEEMSMSNTEGTHGKQSLDRNKLNSLKALVFAKFPVESSEEKEKIWRVIKGKINTKCRVSKLMVVRAS